jgi:hypothetical protein
MYILLKSIYTRCFLKKLGGQLSPHATTLDPPLVETPPLPLNFIFFGIKGIGFEKVG